MIWRAVAFGLMGILMGGTITLLIGKRASRRVISVVSGGKANMLNPDATVEDAVEYLKWAKIILIDRGMYDLASEVRALQVKVQEDENDPNG